MTSEYCIDFFDGLFLLGNEILVCLSYYRFRGLLVKLIFHFVILFEFFLFSFLFNFFFANEIPVSYQETSQSRR